MFLFEVQHPEMTKRAGLSQPSLVQNAIMACGGLDSITAEDENDIRGLAGILYGGKLRVLRRVEFVLI